MRNHDSVLANRLKHVNIIDLLKFYEFEALKQ